LPSKTLRKLDKIGTNCSACAFFQAWHSLEAISKSSCSLAQSRVLCSTPRPPTTHWQNNTPPELRFLQLSSPDSRFGRGVLISKTGEGVISRADRSEPIHKLFKRWLLRVLLLPARFPAMSSGRQELAGRRIERLRVNYNVCKHWLEHCDTNHFVECAPHHLPPPGLRVIDCNRKTIVPYATRDSNSSYLTLSYVWGKSTDENSP
jgi:hypothetical protein